MTDDLEKRLREWAATAFALDAGMPAISAIVKRRFDDLIKAADALAAKDARIAELEKALKKAYEHLMNLQPKIAQHVDEMHQSFIDAYVDVAMEVLDASLGGQHDQ